MSVWFTASAVAPELESRWDLSSNEVAWLTTLVQLGFVAGTLLAAVMNLADVVPSRIYFSISAVLAAAVNALLVGVSGYESALILRFLTGFFLAGVYPPAMKMMATWFRSARGLAIGTVVGALTVGKATPYLLKLLGGAPVSAVIWGASAGAALGGLLVAVAYREGPHPFRRAPFSWGLVAEVVRHRPTRLATYGYLGHMWELYAMWTWVPAFLAASAAKRAAGAMGATGMDAAALTTHSVDLASFFRDRGRRRRVCLGWMDGGPTRKGPLRHPGHGGERCLFTGRGSFFRAKLLDTTPLGAGVGSLRCGRLRAVQCDGHRGRAPAGCRHGPDTPDVGGVSAHDGDHSRCARAPGVIRLELGVSGASARSDPRDRRYPTVRPRPSSLRRRGFSHPLRRRRPR